MRGYRFLSLSQSYGNAKKPKARALTTRLSRRIGFIGYKVFEPRYPLNLTPSIKSLRRSVVICIIILAECYKDGMKKPSLWNCAAFAARTNRKAVCSSDIIVTDNMQKCNEYFLYYSSCPASKGSIRAPSFPEVSTITFCSASSSSLVA